MVRFFAIMDNDRRWLILNKEVMFSSATDNWATPQDFFDKLNSEFHFDLDVCADEINHKCDKYYTKEQDGWKYGLLRVD